MIRAIFTSYILFIICLVATILLEYAVMIIFNSSQTKRKFKSLVMILLAIGGLCAYTLQLHHELAIIIKIPLLNVIGYGLLPIITFLIAGYSILKRARFGW